MYRFILLAAILCAVANAATVPESTEPKEVVKILRSETVNKADGSYNFGYEGADGTIREEGSVITDPGTENESTDIHGSYKYIDPDGKEVEVHYTAGKNGFVPYGSTIPEEITANAQAAANLPNNLNEEEESAYANRKHQNQPQHQLQPQSQHYAQPQLQPQSQPLYEHHPE